MTCKVLHAYEHGTTTVFLCVMETCVLKADQPQMSGQLTLQRLKEITTLHLASLINVHTTATQQHCRMLSTDMLGAVGM